MLTRTIKKDTTLSDFKPNIVQLVYAQFINNLNIDRLIQGPSHSFDFLLSFEKRDFSNITFHLPG